MKYGRNGVAGSNWPLYVDKIFYLYDLLKRILIFCNKLALSYVVHISCVSVVTHSGKYCCQFVKGQQWPELTLHLVQSLSLGQKDAHRTLFSVWQHIFAMPKAKRYVCVCAFCNLVSLVCAIVHEHFSALFLDCQTLLVTRFVGCHYRKRYVNPYDRTDTVQQAEELKRMNEDNNLSLTSRSAMWFSFVHVLLQ